MSFVSDAFGALTGKTAAKKAVANQRRDLALGTEQAGGALGEGYEEAAGYFDPFFDPEAEAYQNLRAMTLGGDYDVTETPGFQWRMDQLGKRMNRELGARGRANSTFGANVMSDAYQDLLGEEFGQQYNRVGNLVNIGRGAGRDLSGLAERRGSNLANLYTGNAMSAANLSGARGDIGQTFSPLNTATSLMSAGTSLYGGGMDLFGGGGGGGGTGILGPTPYGMTWGGR